LTQEEKVVQTGEDPRCAGALPHDDATSARPPLLEARGIAKRFSHIEALRGADFAIRAGEVVGLVGDNGAGKSTLVSILVGDQRPDAGEILLEGRQVTIDSPEEARALGIETVYQDLALADDLDAPANLFLGRELFRGGLLGRLGVLDKAAMRRRAGAMLGDLGVRLDLSLPVASMSGGQRQSVGVCRAASWASRIVFMDEPTAALGVVQTQRVIELIGRVRERGIAVVLISHNLPEVLEVADRIDVLRLGRRVASFRSEEASTERLVAAMTGLEVAA
jgi:simple sugar transport system ATP-binding protein